MLRQVLVQAIGVIATLTWSGTISYILLKSIDKLIGLRVSDSQEDLGIDALFDHK